MVAGIKIDPEFRSQIPPLRAEELQQLEANLSAEGCRESLIIWRGPGILLDGHNRYEICTRLGIAYRTTEIDLPDREAAADWIDANQLGRRNLTPDQYALLRGRRYNRAKKPHGAEPGGRGNQHAVSPQNEDLPKTAETLASQHGVSRATIERDGQFAAAVERVKKVDPQIEAKVVQGKAPARGIIVEAAKQIEKAEEIAKETATTPLLGTRKDQEAARVWEKAKDKAEAILKGDMGTVAQAKKAIRDEEKRAALAEKAKVVQVMSQPTDPGWEIRVGDSLEVLPTLAPGSVRLIFADPPYNIGIDYGEGVDDAMEQRDFINWSQSWIDAASKLLADDGSMWVLINDEWADFFGVMLRDAGLHRRAWIKWYEAFGLNNINNFNRCSRHLFYCVKDLKRFVFNPDAVTRPSDRQAKYGDRRADPGGKLWDDVWGINPPIPRLVGTAAERLPDFPTQLPLQLLTAVVGCSSDPGDLVLDPFNGSGTTGEAAIRLGRRYVGVEKQARFADLARLRLTAARGKPNGAA